MAYCCQLSNQEAIIFKFFEMENFKDDFSKIWFTFSKIFILISCNVHDQFRAILCGVENLHF